MSNNQTFRPTESPIGPVTENTINDDIMRIIWLMDRKFFDTGIVDWIPVIREIYRQCRWYLDVDSIMKRWKHVIYPHIVACRAVAAKYDRELRKTANRYADFPPLLDDELETEMTEKDYLHSLGPYAQLVIEKNEQSKSGETSPCRGRYQIRVDPDGPKLEAKTYIPEDSEKPTTRGYDGYVFVGRSQVFGCDGEDDQTTICSSISYNEGDLHTPVSEAVDPLQTVYKEDEGTDVSDDDFDYGVKEFGEDIYN